MKVITWLSSGIDPRKGVAPGKCVFTGEYPGVFCVPFVEDEKSLHYRLNTFWNGGHRDLQVILDVPNENLFLRLMGREKPLPISPSNGEVAVRRIINKCWDDDNALVIKNFDPQWIVEIKEEF